MSMQEFFQTVMPTSGFKFIATRTQKGFQHFSFSTVEDMEQKAKELATRGQDVYFAPASFEKPSYIEEATGKKKMRTAHNAKAVKAFWLDLDVGADKEEKGDGYASQSAALTALQWFCKTHSLPRPLLVSSGYGIHCYWPLAEEIDKDQWKQTATELKQLAKCLPVLHADPSRTSDISSLLRPLGTRNYKKGGHGAEVKLLKPADPVEYEQFAAKVSAALQRSTTKSAAKKISDGTSEIASTGIPNLASVEAALRHIDPDIGRKDWWKVLAALADVYGEGAKELASRWSAGELHNTKAKSFDPEDFEAQFNDCLQRRGSVEQKVGIGTVLMMAREGGWSGPKPADNEWLVKMNEKYAWIEKERRIYRLEHGDFITPAEFRQEHCNKLIPVAIGEQVKAKEAGDQWIRHPNRRQHPALAMRPNEDEVTKDDCLNTWKGFKVTPAPGSIEPFLKLLQHLFPSKKDAEFVLKWLSHLLQHPEIKMHVALVIWSRKQGVGKNLLFETICGIIGPAHSTVISQAELDRDFNGWARDKIFVIGDEVCSKDRSTQANKLKGLVTGATVQINEKHQPVYETENLMNFVFLSNDPAPLFFDGHDRRYYVAKVDADPLSDEEARAYVQWRDNGGMGALLHKLQQMSLKKFDPKAPAPDTAAKREMANDNRSGLEEWAASIIATGAKNAYGKEVFAAYELAKRYSYERDNPKPTEKAVTAAFKKLGAQTRPNQVRRSGGRKVRVIALDRPEYWLEQPEGVWAKELQSVSLEATA
ncbi:MAG: PriCT-2 domain-containing protein [Paracoccaceae bacterium]